MSYFFLFLYRPRRPPASPDASGLPLFPKEHDCGRLLTFTAKTLHHSTLLSSTQTNAKHLDSAKTPPKPHKHTLYFLLFFRFFFLYLSIFISFFTFFYTSRVAGIFVYLFLFFVSATAGECDRQAGPGRGSGVYGRQIVCTVCVVEEQRSPAQRNVVAAIGLPAKLRFVFFF